MLRPVPLPLPFIPGKLYLSSMPGYQEPLDRFLEEIQDEEVRHILCLVPDAEIAEKSPDYLEAIRSGTLPARFWHHEIPDYGLPENRMELIQDIESMRQALSAGESVVIHCAAGIGRTGLVATMLLMRMGFSLHVASRTVEQAGSSAETDEQQAFLRDV